MRWARTATDIALAGILVLLLAFSAYQLAAVWGSAYWVLDAATGAVVGVIALLRRRDRWRAAGAGLIVAAATVVSARLAGLPTEPGPAMALALAVLVGSAVATLPWRRAGLVVAAGLIVALGSVLSNHGSGVATVNAIGWFAATAAGAWLRLRDVRRRADRGPVSGRTSGSTSPGNSTTSSPTTSPASSCRHKAPGSRGVGTLRSTTSRSAGIESAGAEALTAMRRLVGLLRDGDAMPGPTGLDQLRQLVDRFPGPATQLHLPAGEPSWPPEVFTTVCRIVQESLTNVAQHAPHAGAVTVTVAEAGRSVTVDVVDDAAQASGRYRRGGFGLIGLRERVEALGGTLSAGPCSGAGWAVSASLPLGPAE